MYSNQHEGIGRVEHFDDQIQLTDVSSLLENFAKSLYSEVWCLFAEFQSEAQDFMNAIQLTASDSSNDCAIQ